MVLHSHHLWVLKLLFVSICIFAVGCEQSQISSSQSIVTPELTSITPDSAKFGTNITLKGAHFIPETDRNIVHFNETKAEIVSATSSQIVATVPPRAQSGPVTVTAGNKTSNEIAFTYLLTINVETWAGDWKGYRNDTGTQARFNNPWGMAINSRGDLFIGDSDNFTIRKVERNQNVTTIAGNGSSSGFVDGIGQDARFAQPMGVSLAPNGVLYIADSNNHAIRSVGANRKVGTVAGNGFAGDTDGEATQSQFFNPSDVAISSNKTLYISDGYNFKIRTIGPDNITRTLAGIGRQGFRDGPADEARFMLPVSIALGPEENTLYVADFFAHSIRTVDVNTGRVRTLAGDGTVGFEDGSLNQARFNRPAGIAVNSKGAIFISDSGNHAIRMIKNDKVQTLAGNGEAGNKNGPGSEAQFNRPYHLAVSSSSTYLYISDWGNHQIRRLMIK